MKFGYVTLATLLLALHAPLVFAEAPASKAKKALQVLETHCHRCHGRDGAVEGGFNYVLDAAKLLRRGKVVPGDAEKSALFRRMASGKMPPKGVTKRPTAAELDLVRKWIDSGAASPRTTEERSLVREAKVHTWILADLEKREQRSRRFMRYFSLVPQYNAGAGPDELQTYRNALAKLLNSLSWHPNITLPKAIDVQGLVLAVDLRDFLWDANLWNRLVAEYPYGVLPDTGIARAVLINTGTRMPVIRVDWFVATASRAPLYYELLQIPSNLSELERQLRIDVALDIQQERASRLGFLGSGISRNNRILERHDSMNGAYWRSYDFEAIPQNLIDRDLLLPDRRNVFAYPLGPGLSENTFLHAGGEVIFDLPNGLHGYVLIDANNVRINKGPTAIVSDPKRPDRAVEAGVSCMACHNSGILPKDDQIREHVGKNPKAFDRSEADLIRALYPPKEKMRTQMEADAQRFQRALAKTGNKVTAYEAVMTMTLRYEADVDLETLAAEVGLQANDLLPKLTGESNLAKNLGALRTPGATVARQVVVQTFGDIAREYRLGSVYQPGSLSEILPDNTGELDPLEVQSHPANAASFSPDGRLVALASADRTVVLYDVEAERAIRRFIGHTASVWSVAFSPEGSQLLSGGKDGIVRLWDVATGRELKQFVGHRGLVTAVAFAPNVRRALSVGFDHEAILWDLQTGRPIESFASSPGRYLSAIAFSPNGDRCALATGRAVVILDSRTGKTIQRLEGHADWVTSIVFSPDGKRLVSGSDDATVRLWDLDTGKATRTFTGHRGGIRSLAFSPNGAWILSGGVDATVRLWNATTGEEERQFTRHNDAIVGVTFVADDKATLSVSRDADVRIWRLNKLPKVEPAPTTTNPSVVRGELQVKKVIPIGGTIVNPLVSSDGKTVYYLDISTNTLGKVDMLTGRRTTLALGQGVMVLRPAPDGKTLVVLAPSTSGKTSQIQIVDAKAWKVTKSWSVEIDAYDLAVSDKWLFLTGSEGTWSDVSVLSMQTGKLLTSWGGVWRKSFVRVTSNPTRLYLSTQGVSPGTLDAFVVPEKLRGKPKAYRASLSGRQALGGDMVLSPDGRYLLCKTGTVLRIASDPAKDLRFHTDVKPFVDAIVDPEGERTYVLSRKGTLDVYTYPDFTQRASHRLGIVATGLTYSAKTGELIVAGIDPQRIGTRPRARGLADLFLFEVNGALSKKPEED